MNIQNEPIQAFIAAYMANRAHNTLMKIDAPAFGEPLIGFSSAADPLYPFYKNHIDEARYRLPEEWLAARYGHPYEKEDVSVVSWILPQTEEIKEKCRAEKDCPALEWEYVRVYGEACNRALAAAMEAFFIALGLDAVAPMVSPEFTWLNTERFGPASNWSERHTAHIAGLGTFGLCDGLITPVGKAIRIGSCIVNAHLTPTVRPYTAYNEYCMANKGCTACARRCPAGAITPDGGHDKDKCRAYHKDFIKPLCSERYGYEDYAVCGLCQTGVPCESGIPKAPGAFDR